jgi:hypothetical protein
MVMVRFGTASPTYPFAAKTIRSIPLDAFNNGMAVTLELATENLAGNRLSPAPLSKEKS